MEEVETSTRFPPWARWTLRILIEGLIVAIIAGLVTFWLIEKMQGEAYPAMVEDLRCSPAEITSATPTVFSTAFAGVSEGAKLRCVLTAPNAEYVTWRTTSNEHAILSGRVLVDHDPTDECPGSTQDAVSACQEYVFQRSGLYEVRAKVAREGGDSVDEGVFSVEVLEKPAEAVRLRLQAVVPPSELARAQSIPVNRTQSASDGFTQKTKSYTDKVFTADAESEIDDARFQGTSVNNTRNIKVEVSGKSVYLKYQMRSGMVMDKYRAWIKGAVVVDVVTRERAKTVLNTELNAEISTPVFLRDLDIEPDVQFDVSIGPDSGSLSLNESATIGDFVVSIRDEHGTAVLEVARSGAE